jgi:hypothetical protein
MDNINTCGKWVLRMGVGFWWLWITSSGRFWAWEMDSEDGSWFQVAQDHTTVAGFGPLYFTRNLGAGFAFK